MPETMPTNFHHKLNSSEKRILIGIILLALILRSLFPILCYLLNRDPNLFYYPDTYSYIAPAISMLHHGTFATDGVPEIGRTPGYPLMLIPAIALGHIEAATIVIQILLSCLTVYLVFLIAFALFKNANVALTSAALFAVEPLSIFYSSILLTETLFTALSTLFLYFLTKYLRSSTNGYLIFLAASVLAFAIYVRPAGYFVPLIGTAIICGRSLSKKSTFRTAVFHSLIMLFVCYGLVGIWQLRNYAKTGTYVFSSIGADNLLFYNAAEVLAVKENIGYGQAQNNLGYGNWFQVHPEQIYWTKKQILDWKLRESFSIILSNPLLYTKLHLRSSLLATLEPGFQGYARLMPLFKEPAHARSANPTFFTGQAPGLSYYSNQLIRFLSRPSWILTGDLLLMLYLFWIYGAFTYGMLRNRALSDSAFLAILIVILYYLLIPGAAVAYSRYRAPCMPLFCAVAGYGTYLMFRILKTRLFVKE